MTIAKRIFLILTLIFIAVPAFAQDVDLGDFGDLKDDQKDAISDTKKDAKDYLKPFDLDGTEFFTDFRAGFLGLTGNTKSISVSGGNHTKYRYKRFENNWKVGGYYSRVFSITSNSGLTGTTARYLYGIYRLDYYLTDKTSLFVGGGGYSDRFSGVDRAGVGMAGARHFLLRKPSYFLSIAGGYDYEYEDRVTPRPSVGMNSVLGEVNYWQQYNDNVSLTNDLQFLEDFIHGHNFRLKNKTELKVRMTRRLALVTSFEVRLRNEPVPGFKKVDTITELLLSAKF
jgi:putative salt-induced outer membrane protein YdiY